MGKEIAAKSKARTTKSQPASSAPAAEERPKWPIFKPALPVTYLELAAPITGHEKGIRLVHSFWPKSLCRDYVSFLRELPLTTTGGPKRGEALRVNDRYQIDDFPFAQRLWLETGLKELVSDDAYKDLWGGEPVGLNPNIRVYRYRPSQKFEAHYDDYNLVKLPHRTGVMGTKTTWTLLLYLTSATEGCIGGETVFYPHDRKVKSEELPVAPETGMLLLHKHGSDCLLHEGREVLQGEKPWSSQKVQPGLDEYW